MYWLNLCQKMKENDAKTGDAISKDPNLGIHAHHWFYGAAERMLTMQKARAPKKEAAPEPIPQSEPTAQNKVLDLLTKHPGISGATFLNLLKANGLQIVDHHAEDPKHEVKEEIPVKKESKKKKKKKAEADSASANTQVLRQSNQKIHFTAKFQESSASDNGIGYTRFKVTLIQEGLGNFGDAYYYSAESLKNAVNIFEGKKIYADHPSSSEEAVRPERSVRDVLGHFENIEFVEDSGRGMIQGEVVIMPDKPYEWARGLMRQAVEFQKKFPDKEFVGLSINASGDANVRAIDEVISIAPEGAKLKLNEAKQKGIENVRFVTAITDAVSCDLVTEAGAGGKINQLMEGEKPMQDEQQVKHDDAAQDVELIKKMLDEYLGKEEGASEEEVAEMEKMAKEAFEGYKEMGYSEDEAMKAAGHAMKLSKHMAAKMSKKAEADGEAKEEESKKMHQEECDEEKHEEKKEAAMKQEEKAKKMEAEIIALKGKLALLETNAKKTEIAKYVDQKLSESKMAKSFTKKFLEAAGEIKSKEDFETKWKLFTGGREHQMVDLNFAFTEKATTVESNNDGRSKLDFSACAD